MWVAWRAHALVLHMLCTQRWLPGIRHVVSCTMSSVSSAPITSCVLFTQLVFECPHSRCRFQHDASTAQPMLKQTKQTSITHALCHDVQVDAEEGKNSVQRLTADLAAAESRNQSHLDNLHSDWMQQMDQQVFQSYCSWYHIPFCRCIHPSCHHDQLDSSSVFCALCHCCSQQQFAVVLADQANRRT